MRFNPHRYQREAVEHLLANPRACLFFDMGLGKTAVTLMAIKSLISNAEVHRVLVVAPKRVAEHVWAAEAEKWDDFSGLIVETVSGDARRRREAMAREAHVYVVGRDNLHRLVRDHAHLLEEFDMLVLDELTSFKKPATQRFRAVKKLTGRMRRVVGLTGTPIPGGYENLWAQLYCVDMGASLGPRLGDYYATYFDPEKTNGHIVYSRRPKKGAVDAIRERIAPICLTRRTDDHLDLPPFLATEVAVHLPKPAMERYKEFEKEQVDGITEQINALTAGSLVNKLQQFAGGAVYTEDGAVRIIHDEKLAVLDELVEGLDGEPVLIAYAFRHERERILRTLARHKPRTIDEKDVLKDWNAGRVPVMVAHPASAGHGLNLQDGGRHIIWFAPTWDLELFAQFNARLRRQGQTGTVCLHLLVAVGTVDERVWKAVEGKDRRQVDLLEVLKGCK